MATKKKDDPLICYVRSVSKTQTLVALAYAFPDGSVYLTLKYGGACNESTYKYPDVEVANEELLMLVDSERANGADVTVGRVSDD